MTLYEILGVLPGASRHQIERAYRAQLKLLAPAMIAGSSTKVLKAVDRARATAEQAWRVLDALAGWLAPDPGPARRVVVPDVCGLFAGPGQRAAGGAGLRLKIVRLTANPMPVEGLIVGQSPAKDAKVRRFATLTVQVWHPAARPAGWP